MASSSAHRRSMILNALRKLLAAGAMSTVIRAAINQGDRSDLARKARQSVQGMIRRAVLCSIAGLFFVIAAGFLVAAIYLGLREAFIAPIAALLTGLLLIATGALILFLGRRKVEQELVDDAPAVAEEMEQRPPTDAILEFVQDMIRNAGKNVGLVVAALFLIGLWFGFGQRKSPDEDDSESAASPGRDDDPWDDDADAAPLVREQSRHTDVNRQRTEVS